MQTPLTIDVWADTLTMYSVKLAREVKLTVYLPAAPDKTVNPDLLLVNDGQDLEAMGFDKMIGYLLHEAIIHPLMCVGIHCGEERLNEYGVSLAPDFKGRGAKAGLYREFIAEELLPFIRTHYDQYTFRETAIAGFSLGGLSALDIAWGLPGVFSKVGVFSGSFWWRSVDRTDKAFNENKHRLMHRSIREGKYQPGLKFFFECGEQDEKEDRNNNGVIDSIDDTLDVMRELAAKGYKEGKNRDMYYLQLKDGKHDVTIWAKALPVFLKWGWKKKI
ncbi:MAG: alpha/beta hydrolase-fold protein [Chitinophagaceae bacterium]